MEKTHFLPRRDSTGPFFIEFEPIFIIMITTYFLLRKGFWRELQAKAQPDWKLLRFGQIHFW